MKNRRIFSSLRYSLSSEFYFSPKMRGSMFRFSRLSRISSLEQIPRSSFYDYYLFSIYSSYARAASRRRMLGNHPHSSNSVKQVILHGTNISWISSNVSTLVPSSCIYIYEFFWSLKLKIIFYRYKILTLEEFRRIFSHPYDGVHK